MSRLSDRIHGQLRRMLLTGELPYNDFLGEERLARMLGCSRTPIREAFFRLEAEGFLERDASGHFRPRPPQLDRMRELYSVRNSLEQLSVATATNRQLLEDLLEEWRSADPDDADDDFVYLDEAFHIGLATASGNLALVEMLRTVNDRIRIIRIHDFMTPGRIATTINQHRAILNALLVDDREGATALMSSHIQESASYVEQAAMRLMTRVFTGTAK
jgi:DNA-binding GntR family transcriptional regulator